MKRAFVCLDDTQSARYVRVCNASNDVEHVASVDRFDFFVVVVARPVGLLCAVEEALASVVQERATSRLLLVIMS